MKCTSKTPELFTYDADGNMTSDGRFHYTWNGENRLVMASNDTVVVTYAYDHRGRMVTKTLCSSAPLRLIKSITYLWDDWNIIREIVREGDSVAVTDNIWGLDIDGTLQGAGGVGGLLAVVRHNSSTPNSSTHQLYFPTYYANGNISEYISASGEIVAHYDYSPFGEILVASGPLANSFPHRFSTKPWCAVTGFNEYVYRKYSPDIGRWVSRDSYRELDNMYLFVNNASLQFVDPDGEQAINVGLYGRNSREGAFAGWAKQFSPDHNYEVSFGLDFVNALVDATTEKCCIGKLVHFYHGYGYRDFSQMYVDNKHSYPNELIISEETSFNNGLWGEVPTTHQIDSNAATLDDILSRIKKKEIIFCDTCSIIFTGCRIGQTAFPAALARTTGCKVTAAMAGSSPDEPIRSNGKKRPSGKWKSSPSYWEERNEPYTGWVEFAPDGSPKKVGERIAVW